MVFRYKGETKYLLLPKVDCFFYIHCLLQSKAKTNAAKLSDLGLVAYIVLPLIL